jgi:hypothetical protein
MKPIKLNTVDFSGKFLANGASFALGLRFAGPHLQQVIMAERFIASLALKHAWKEFPSIENTTAKLLSKVAPSVRAPSIFA